MGGDDSYHVAVNRYAEVYGHFDQKSLARREFQRSATRDREDLVATLNGSVTVPISQVVTKQTLPGRPVSTMMGETCWTWMREDQAVQFLKAKGYAHIQGLRRGEHGNWTARAIKDDLALRVDIDWYGNTQNQPVNRHAILTP
jgi:hypothetical protein